MGRILHHYSSYVCISLLPFLLQLSFFSYFMLLYMILSVLVTLLWNYLLRVSTYILSLFIISSLPWINSRRCHCPRLPCKRMNKWISLALNYWLGCCCWICFRHCPTILDGYFFALHHRNRNQCFRRSKSRAKYFSKSHQLDKFISGRNPRFNLYGGVSKATLDAFCDGSNYFLQIP